MARKKGEDAEAKGPAKNTEAPPEGSVWMVRDGERAAVCNDASVDVMAALGWKLEA